MYLKIYCRLQRDTMIRDHPFKTSVNILRFLTPYRRQFFTAIHHQIWQIFDPSPLKNADILNEWSITIIKSRLLACLGWENLMFFYCDLMRKIDFHTVNMR